MPAKRECKEGIDTEPSKSAKPENAGEYLSCTTETQTGLKVTIYIEYHHIYHILSILQLQLSRQKISGNNIFCYISVVF
jgi:hypothetical protein